MNEDGWSVQFPLVVPRVGGKSTRGLGKPCHLPWAGGVILIPIFKLWPAVLRAFLISSSCEGSLATTRSRVTRMGPIQRVKPSRTHTYKTSQSASISSKLWVKSRPHRQESIHPTNCDARRKWLHEGNPSGGTLLRQWVLKVFIYFSYQAFDWIKIQSFVHLVFWSSTIISDKILNLFHTGLKFAVAGTWKEWWRQTVDVSVLISRVCTWFLLTKTQQQKCFLN